MKLVGERRALAAAVLAFYSLLYIAFALSGYAGPNGTAFIALGTCYGLAFFGLVAGYFWARWFAIGVAMFGVLQGAVSWWVMGLEPIVIFLGGTHLFAAVVLWGEGMGAPFDGKAEWREKFHMDEHAVKRLGRSVMRAGFGLPFVLLYAFSPKPDTATIITALAAFGLAAGGLRALVKMKTWGVLALGGSGALLGASALAHATGHGTAVAPVLASITMLAAAAPFAMPILRSVAASDSHRSV
jgi:hypothetical protein